MNYIVDPTGLCAASLELNVVDKNVRIQEWGNKNVENVLDS